MRLVGWSIGLLFALLLFSACATDDDVESMAESDLSCRSVKVFTIAGPDPHDDVFVGHHQCGRYTTWRYKVDGCERTRFYDCKECANGPKRCTAEPTTYGPL
jgi:hypothetical protein